MRKLKVGIVVLALTALLASTAGAALVKNRAFGANPRSEVIEYSETALDVSAASGTGAVMDIEDGASITVSCFITALTGGTSPSVTPRLEHSQDGTNWVQVAAYTTMTQGQASNDSNVRQMHRKVRIAWTTAGSPATATMTYFVTVRRNG